MLASELCRSDHLPDVRDYLHMRLALGTSPHDDVGEADRNEGIELPDTRYKGADLLKSNGLLRLMHGCKGFLRARVERKPHPILFHKDGSDLTDLLIAGAVADDAYLHLVLFEEAHDVPEFRVECRFTAADEDDRTQATLDQIPQRFHEYLVVVFCPAVQHVPIDAVGARVVAGGREVEVQGKRPPPLRHPRGLKPLNFCVAHRPLPIDVGLHTPELRLLPEFRGEIVPIFNPEGLHGLTSLV